MQSKAQVLSHLKNFIVLIKNQFNKSAQLVRTDNAREFFNHECSSLFISNGILHESSCVYTPQQNGIVERKHRHLLEVARALKYQASFPEIFWGDYVVTAAYLINRMPSRILSGKTPFESLFGKRPDIRHLRVFGCLCYVSTTGPQEKFGPRALSCVFMGYPTLQKGYLVLDPSTGRFFVSRDVTFHEDVFPFKDRLPSYQHDDPLTSSRPFLHEDDPPQGSMMMLPQMISPIASSSIDAPISSDGDNAISSLPSSSTPEGPDFLQANIPGDDISAASQIDVPSEPTNLRRSRRTVRPPTWTADYVCSSSKRRGTQYPISSYVSFANLSLEHRCCVSRISAQQEPSSYDEAAKDPRWQQAMKDELQALIENETWDIVRLPPHRRSIGCKCVYKIKYKAGGSIERYKARLVAKGFR